MVYTVYNALTDITRYELQTNGANGSHPRHKKGLFYISVAHNHCNVLTELQLYRLI